MSYYIKTLFYAIPTFAFLILLEAIVAKVKGIEINRSADVIASLSSGITNTIRDAIKFTFALLTYSWLVENIAVYKLESYWLVIFVAFLVKDFSGYWVHRLNHRVNVLWNRHFIHHSSEDFNLSCALRQSISNTIKFSAIFMIPGALLGVPASVFAVLGPIHLFMQLWYHTQLIGNLGVLEYIFVTPSHHRVHHAINDEYIDKNYGQILIIWDKILQSANRELKLYAFKGEPGSTSIWGLRGSRSPISAIETRKPKRIKRAIGKYFDALKEEKILELNGVGFRANLKGEVLNLQIGFSHDVNFKIPKEVKITVEKQTIIKLNGVDKELVSKIAADIKNLKPVEPYKAKGIKERGQFVLRKEGKKKKKSEQEAKHQDTMSQSLTQKKKRAERTKHCTKRGNMAVENSATTHG